MRNFIEEAGHAAGREAETSYDIAAAELDAQEEAKLWDGRVPYSNEVTHYCGDCGMRNVGRPLHKPDCPNLRR